MGKNGGLEIRLPAVSQSFEASDETHSSASTAQAIDPVPLRDRASSTDCPANSSVQPRMEKLAAVRRCDEVMPVIRRGRECDNRTSSIGGIAIIEITEMSHALDD